MKRGSKTLVCLICLIALTTRVRATLNDAVQVPAVSDNPASATKANNGDYSSIWLRNVFDLKPIITGPIKDNAPPAPPANIKLQGITTILGDKRAIIAVQEPSSPGKPPVKEESYMLTEGQRQGGLEVLEINPQARTVKVKMDELISTITFDTNRPPAGAAPGNMAGGGVPRPVAAPPLPGFRPSGGYTPAPENNSAPAMPFRQVRTADNSQYTPQSTGGYMGGYAQASYQAPAASGAAGGVSLGSLFNTPQSQPQPSQQQSEPALTAEQQVIATLAQQVVHKAEVEAGTFPPMPPLPGVPVVAVPPTGASSSPPMPPMPPGFDPSDGPPMPTLPPGYKVTGTYH